MEPFGPDFSVWSTSVYSDRFVFPKLVSCACLYITKSLPQLQASED